MRRLANNTRRARPFLMHSHIFLRTRLENLPFTTTTARRAARERLQCTEMHRATYGRECAALRRFRQPADDFFVSARKFSPPPIRHGTVGLRGRQSKYTKVSEVSSRPTSNFAILIVALRCWFSFSTSAVLHGLFLARVVLAGAAGSLALVPCSRRIWNSSHRLSTAVVCDEKLKSRAPSVSVVFSLAAQHHTH